MNVNIVDALLFRAKRAERELRCWCRAQEIQFRFWEDGVGKYSEILEGYYDSDGTYRQMPVGRTEFALAYAIAEAETEGIDVWRKAA
jgi:hypothetical protein